MYPITDMFESLTTFLLRRMGQDRRAKGERKTADWSIGSNCRPTWWACPSHGHTREGVRKLSLVATQFTLANTATPPPRCCQRSCFCLPIRSQGWGGASAGGVSCGDVPSEIALRDGLNESRLALSSSAPLILLHLIETCYNRSFFMVTSLVKRW